MEILPNKIISDYSILEQKVLNLANRLNQKSSQEIDLKVAQIIEQVRLNGKKALIDFSLQFDKQKIENFSVSAIGYWDQLKLEQKNAVKLACERIKRFQEICLPTQNTELIDEYGILKVLHNPIDSVACYIPGGHAPLISTLMMTAIPAMVAKVKRIIVLSPPPIHPYILAVCEYLNLTEIYQIGGSQAIAAAAYGIAEIGLKSVDKLVGPGNLFVTSAKKQVYGQTGIDALYGPSELIIIADEFIDNHKAKQIAHDLMSQLEHGSGWESACLFTNSAETAQKVLQSFTEILDKQPNKESIKKAWDDFGLIGITDNLEQCAALSNIFAPEHLELKVKDYQSLLPQIRHAGAIFINDSNEALGDYLAGPSHCLPTGRSARFSSGLSVLDFLKRSSLIDLKPDQNLKQNTAILARMEGLEAHAQAAEI